MLPTPLTGVDSRTDTISYMLTWTEDGGGLPTYNADGSKVLFLYLDYIISGDELVGAYHRLILMNPDGSEQEQMIPDDRHTPTLEYYDW